MTNPAPEEDLPLFPLATVVFPHALLPLQIFELRYLQMMGECERTGTGFGVVTLTRGREVHRPGGPPEAFEPIGTRMQLLQVQRPQPGLLHIWCRAIDRFEILQSHQRSDGLWRAKVQALPEEPQVAVPEHLQSLSTQMQHALNRLAQQAMDLEPWPKPWQVEDCSWLSCRWAECLPLPTEMKYRLFALQDPLMRLELVGDLIASGQQPATGP